MHFTNHEIMVNSGIEEKKLNGTKNANPRLWL
jgi:hypothetical protein